MIYTVKGYRCAHLVSETNLSNQCIETAKCSKHKLCAVIAAGRTAHRRINNTPAAVITSPVTSTQKRRSGKCVLKAEAKSVNLESRSNQAICLGFSKKTRAGRALILYLVGEAPYCLENAVEK
jgi:hypothetical protein